jgi:glycosyltransferase involved in cell wall biosynthesis
MIRDNNQMNILLITNRYPKNSDDPASPFVPDFVHALRGAGARVIVQTPLYGIMPAKGDPDVYRFRFGQDDSEEPIGSWNILKPRTWWSIFRFVESGENAVDELVQRYAIDHILALWALPSGWFAHYAARKWNIPYSVWCLGSDIHNWARRPLFGRLTREILTDARLIFADGFALAKSASRLSGRFCRYLPSCRRLGDLGPSAEAIKSGHPYFLYAGRIHRDKGIFDLLVAFYHA